MLSVGLYFGLRSLAPDEIAVASAGLPAEAPPPPSPPPPPVLDPAVVQQHAVNALAYHRGTLRQECYLPAVAGESPLPTLSFEFNFTFSPEGVQIARGVTETRSASRPAITQCVLAKLPPLRIPPPAQVARVTAPLSFP